MAVISKEQVFSACDRLAREQGRFTQAEVVACTGGSLSRIGPWVREWQQLKQHLREHPEISPALLAQLNNWCAQLRQELAEDGAKALRQLEDTNKALEEQRYVLEQRLEEQDRALTRAEQELEARLQQNVQLRKQLEQAQDECRRRAEEQQAHVAQLEQQLTLSQAREARLAQQIDKEQERAQQQVKEEGERISRLYEANENKLFTQLDQLRQQRDNEQKRAQQEQEMLRRTLDQAREALGASERRREQTALQLEAKEEQRARAEALCAHLDARTQEQARVLEASQQAATSRELELQRTLTQACVERDQTHVQLQQFKQQVETLQNQLFDLAHRSAPPQRKAD